MKNLFEARSPGSQGALERSAAEVWFFDKLVLGINRVALNVRNTWLLPLNLGDYGDRYALRALVTLIGFGANRAVDAVYPSTTVDADGEPLQGGRAYVLRFAKGELPPARDFWSLTLYDDRMFFTANPIGRYAIGNRHTLKANPDGSTDILIQHENPGPGRESNWLPAPKGPFKLMLRLYGPDQRVLDNQWAPPAVQRLPAAGT